MSLVPALMSSLKAWALLLLLLCLQHSLLAQSTSRRQFMEHHHLSPNKMFSDYNCDVLMTDKAVKPKLSHMFVYMTWYKVEHICIGSNWRDRSHARLLSWVCKHLREKSLRERDFSWITVSVDSVNCGRETVEKQSCHHRGNQQKKGYTRKLDKTQFIEAWTLWPTSCLHVAYVTPIAPVYTYDSPFHHFQIMPSHYESIKGLMIFGSVVFPSTAYLALFCQSLVIHTVQLTGEGSIYCLWGTCTQGHIHFSQGSNRKIVRRTHSSLHNDVNM